MFALAMVLDFSGEIAGTPAETKPVELTFHATVEAARKALIENILETLGREDIKTIEDFIAEAQAGGDLKGVDVDAMNPYQLIDWVHGEALGEEVPLSYKITEVPASL
jgi:hypothetical protein